MEGPVSASCMTESREMLAAAAEQRALRGDSVPPLLPAAPAPAPAPKAEPDPAASSDQPQPASDPSASPAALELRGTASSFGTPLADLPDGVSARVVIATPRDGSTDFENASAVQGAICVMWRGGCSFVDKVRRAQKAGAVAAVVVQTAPSWPFTMSDTAGKGKDVLLPSLMLSAADGETLLRTWEGEAGSSSAAPVDGSSAAPDDGSMQLDVSDAMPVGPPLLALWGHARAHNHHTSCAVCMEEFVSDEMAVRLPCDHRFHESCVRTWLKKNFTCPTCRTPLPRADGAADAEGPRDRDLEADMQQWAELVRGDRVIGTAPMPASGMYT